MKRQYKEGVVAISIWFKNVALIILHYPSWRSLRQSGFFDRQFYMDNNPDVRESGINPVIHYLRYGAKEWRQPGPAFDAISYCNRYEDVAKQGLNPLLHYLRYGRKEGREVSMPLQRGLSRALEYWLADATYKQGHIVSEGDTEIQTALQSIGFLKKTLVERHAIQRQDCLVSIIMPFANDESTLQVSIESVLTQTYGNLELILCCDACTDGSLGIAETFTKNDARVRNAVSNDSQGPAAARNRGLAKSRGRYIAYLDADDIWDKDFLSIMVGEAKATDADFMYCAQYVWERSAWEHGRKFDFIRYNAFHRSKLENTNYISVISVLHHRRLYELHGGFDEELLRVEDYDIALRYTATSRVRSVPVPLCHYLIDKSRRKQSLKKRGPIEPALNRIRGRVREGRELRLQELTRLTAHTLYAHMSADQPPQGGVNRLIERVTYVVIPSNESLEYLQACVAALCAYTEQFHCIIVDNGSSQSLSKYLGSLRADNFSIIFQPKAVGFAKAVNIGLKQVPPEHDVAILSSAAIVTPNWLNALYETVEAEPSAGIVAPQQVLLPQDPTIHQHIPDADPLYECDVALSYRHKNVTENAGDSQKTIQLSFASFFCVLIRAALLVQIPKLHETQGRHVRSDIFYCHLARQMGSSIVYSPNAKVYHLRS